MKTYAQAMYDKITKYNRKKKCIIYVNPQN